VISSRVTSYDIIALSEEYQKNEQVAKIGKT